MTPYLNNTEAIKPDYRIIRIMKGGLVSLLKDNKAIIGILLYHSPENDFNLTYTTHFEITAI
jgi:hypothetical protein